MLDAMLPYLVSYYGNPHSRTHAYGWETEAAVEKARQVNTEHLLKNIFYNSGIILLIIIIIRFLMKMQVQG